MARLNRNHGRKLIRISIPIIGIAMIGVGLLLKMMQAKPTYANADLKALGYFPLDQVHGSINDIPAQFRAMDGKRVELLGFMFSPTSARASVSDFQFVYSFTRSELRGPPLVQERVFAHAARAVPLFASDTPVELEGVLHIAVKHDPADGTINSVYQMDVEKVIDPSIGSNYTPPSPLWGIEGFLVPIGVLLLVGASLWELLLLIRRYPSKVIMKWNVCSVCGYDTRTSPERCPECGTRTGRNVVLIRTPHENSALSK